MKPKVLHLRAVIFDMDGVITHTMPDHHRAWKEALNQYGVHISHHDIYSREGQPGDEALKEILTLKEYSFTNQDLERILREKERHFKEYVKQRFIVGSRSFLRALAKENFCLALVTGTSRHELHKILPRNLYDLFHVLVTGNDVTTGKPHPEPFLKALDQLHVDPGDAVVIENAPYGIQSATAAGLRVLALETSLPKSYLKGAWASFSSIKEMRQKITFRFKV